MPAIEDSIKGVHLLFLGWILEALLLLGVKRSKGIYGRGIKEGDEAETNRF